MKYLASFLTAGMLLIPQMTFSDEKVFPKIKIKDVPSVRAEQLIGSSKDGRILRMTYKIKKGESNIGFVYILPENRNEPPYCPIFFAKDLDRNGFFEPEKGELSEIIYDKNPDSCLVYDLIGKKST